MACIKPKTLKEVKPHGMGRQTKLAFHVAACLRVHCMCLLTAVADGNKNSFAAV